MRERRHLLEEQAVCARVTVPAGTVVSDFGSVIVGGQIFTGEWCMVKTGRYVQLVIKLERRKNRFVCQAERSLPRTMKFPAKAKVSLQDF